MTKEERREYYREYYKKHKEQYTESRKKWAATHKSYKTDYYNAHKEQYKTNSQKWREKNKEKWVEMCSNNRRKRAEKLREQGYTNPYDIINHPSKYKDVK